MQKLIITQEYKFKRGGTEFHISEGENLKVKLASGDIYEGTLIKVSGIAECFDVETVDGIITIDCENVVDMTPV